MTSSSRDLSLSSPSQAGSYTRREILVDGVGIGHISYKATDKVLSIDMIRIGDSAFQKRGYATATVLAILKETGTDTIAPTEDGLTYEGRQLFESLDNSGVVNVSYSAGKHSDLAREGENGAMEELTVPDNATRPVKISFIARASKAPLKKTRKKMTKPVKISFLSRRKPCRRGN